MEVAVVALELLARRVQLAPLGLQPEGLLASVMHFVATLRVQKFELARGPRHGLPSLPLR